MVLCFHLNFQCDLPFLHLITFQKHSDKGRKVWGRKWECVRELNMLNMWKEIPNKQQGRNTSEIQVQPQILKPRVEKKSKNALRQSSFSKNSCNCFIDMKISARLCFLFHLHRNRPQRDGSCNSTSPFYYYPFLEMNRHQTERLVLLGLAAKTDMLNIYDAIYEKLLHFRLSCTLCGPDQLLKVQTELYHPRLVW